MGFEQPKNIIEDPLENKEPEIELEPKEDIKPSENRLSNVIEGPWPKKELEPKIPEEVKPTQDEEKLIPTETEPKTESDIEQITELEKARQNLEEISNREENKKSEDVSEKSGNDGGGDSERRSRSYDSEVYTEYRRCERCNGKKRIWLIFVCPVCKGFGSIPVKTTTTTIIR